MFAPENSGIPHCAASKDIYRSKYALTREVIYQHLAAHLHKKNSDIQVCRFPAVNSPEFQSHVQTYSVYFAMCHNGAMRRQGAQTAESMLHVLQRVMASGLDVAIINEIEWRDTKVSSLLFDFIVKPDTDTDFFSLADHDKSHTGEVAQQLSDGSLRRRTRNQEHRESALPSELHSKFAKTCEDCKQ